MSGGLDDIRLICRGDVRGLWEMRRHLEQGGDSMDWSTHGTSSPGEEQAVMFYNDIKIKLYTIYIALSSL